MLSFVKRVKMLMEEVVGLGVESKEEEMEGMIKRIEGLVKDLEFFVKVVSGIKVYSFFFLNMN